MTLREAAEKRGVMIGSCVNLDALRSDSAYRDLLAREFNLVIAENGMKWREHHPTRHTFDFLYGDLLCDFAEVHDMRVIGHNLAWHMAIPAWMQVADHSREEWLKILKEYIYTVVGHYRGRVYGWHVVNEVFELDGSYSDVFWRERIGADYIAQAFRWAHDADPDAQLYFNEWDADGHKPTAQFVLDLVKDLTADGVPIHGVGLQMHIATRENDWVGAPPTSTQVATQVQRLAGLGMKVHISEMDVMVQYETGTDAEKLSKQATVYRDVLTGALQSPQFKAINIWGLTDKHSWIPAVTNTPDSPTLFDANYQPKPAYYAVLDALKG